MARLKPPPAPPRPPPPGKVRMPGKLPPGMGIAALKPPRHRGRHRHRHRGRRTGILPPGTPLATVRHSRAGLAVRHGGQFLKVAMHRRLLDEQQFRRPFHAHQGGLEFGKFVVQHVDFDVRTRGFCRASRGHHPHSRRFGPLLPIPPPPSIGLPPGIVGSRRRNAVRVAFAPGARRGQSVGAEHGIQIRADRLTPPCRPSRPCRPNSFHPRLPRRPIRPSAGKPPPPPGIPRRHRRHRRRRPPALRPRAWRWDRAGNRLAA